MVLLHQQSLNKWHQFMCQSLFITFTSMLTYIPNAMALDTDSSQPIHLEADSANINDNEGLHQYEGNVSITQGSMQITAHKVTAIFQDQDISQFIAIGNQQTPAYMTQTLNNKNQPMEAWAQQINYHTDQALITLQGGGRLLQEGNEFLGETITFSTDDETLILKSKPNTNDRVQLTILPDS